MKQFFTILKFELGGYIKNKGFIIFSFFLVILMALFLFSPRYLPAIMDLFSDDEPTTSTIQYIDVNGDVDVESRYIPILNEQFKEDNIKFVKTDKTVEEMKEAIINGEIIRGVYITSSTSYIDVIEDINLYDSTSSKINDSVEIVYQHNLLEQSGISHEQSLSIINPQIIVENAQVDGGVNQAQNFLYTYILIFLLYFGVIVCGQYVVSSIVTEKTSRAMEVLVTSAKPTAFIFAKVIGTGIAGISQLFLILASAFLFYNFNAEFWSSNPLVASLFDIPLSLIGFMLIFFILGFFIYAFMFGAAGSLASKIEDMGSLITPITLLFVAAFLITSMSLSSGSVDSTLMYVSSFVPFTSPMAMFSRIAMSNVPAVEIIISIVILVITTALIGILATKIYRYGVFFYGNKPNLFKVIKLMFLDMKRK